jgi:hypothetical protein
MTAYGNKMWHKATNNDEKTVVPLVEKDLKPLCTLMENAGLNFYAFSHEGKCRIAFNTKDLDIFKRIVGKDLADKLAYQKPEREYKPPEKNIIGNTEYRYIPQKSYFKADRDVALKMADIMKRQGIQFSGRIYGDNTANLTVSAKDYSKLADIKNAVISRRQSVLTVSEPDMPKVEQIHSDVAEMRSVYAKPKKHKDEIIGNKKYKDIAHKEYYSPDISPERYKKIKPYLDEQAQYSGLIRDGRVIFTVESGEAPDFIRSLLAAENECDIINDLKKNGFEQAKIDLLKDVIHTAANRGEQFLDFVDNRYSEDDLNRLIQPLNAYYIATEYERMADKGGVVTDLLNVQQEIEDNIRLAEIYSGHDFSDEQKKLIADGMKDGLSDTILSEIDESFTAEQIEKYFEMYNQAVNGEIEPSDVQDYLDNRRFEAL